MNVIFLITSMVFTVCCNWVAIWPSFVQWNRYILHVCFLTALWACATWANACFVLIFNDTTIQKHCFTVEAFAFLLVIFMVIWVRLEHAAWAFVSWGSIHHIHVWQLARYRRILMSRSAQTRSHSFLADTPKVLFSLQLLALTPGPSFVLPQVNELISCLADRVTSERARAPPITSCDFQPDLIECIALLIIAPIYRWWKCTSFLPFLGSLWSTYRMLVSLCFIQHLQQRSSFEDQKQWGEIGSATVCTSSRVLCLVMLIDLL